MKPDNFGKVVNVSLHHFSDVSDLGYGQCSYISMANEIDRVHCNLLLEKSRVVPRKFKYQYQNWSLKKDLKLGEIKKWYWTDSKVVVGYITNDARRFKTFVANRVQQIRENNDVQQ